MKSIFGMKGVQSKTSVIIVIVIVFVMFLLIFIDQDLHI